MATPFSLIPCSKPDFCRRAAWMFLPVCFLSVRPEPSFRPNGLPDAGCQAASCKAGFVAARENAALSGHRLYLNVLGHHSFSASASNTPAQRSLPAAVRKLESDMVRVAGGAFTMGCQSGRDTECENTELPSHKVRIRNFSIGRFEVTQAQWQAVMGINPSYYGNCKNCPVENISWLAIKRFLVMLNTMTGKHYRLPTEAEWEYAARGGKRSLGYPYSGSQLIDEVAWYGGNSGGTTHAIGGKKPNELGLYDMTGNVQEWCEDDWHPYYQGAPTNSSAWVDRPRASLRVVRGGGWLHTAMGCRVSGRKAAMPPNRSSFGFRLAL